jgi:hypothetical protein
MGISEASASHFQGFSVKGLDYQGPRVFLLT